jgi:hypothetical protein
MGFVCEKEIAWALRSPWYPARPSRPEKWKFCPDATTGKQQKTRMKFFIVPIQYLVKRFNTGFIFGISHYT